jgi:hypothetical protein
LRTLSVGGASTTAAGLKDLTALRELRDLYLGAAWVTGVGLKQLVAMKGLHTLRLGGAPVTDAGLKEVAALKGLQTLDLRETGLAISSRVLNSGVKATVLLRVNPPNRSNAKTSHFLEGAHSLEISTTVRTFETAIQAHALQ